MSLPAYTPTQPYTSGAGTGGPGAYSGGTLNAGNSLFGGAVGMSGSAGAGGGGGGSGGGYSGSLTDQQANLNQLKSDNKNKLATNLDLSGAAGQRGAVFNFGTNVNPVLSSAGGSSVVIWLVLGAGVLGLVGFFLLRRKG